MPDRRPPRLRWLPLQLATAAAVTVGLVAWTAPDGGRPLAKRGTVRGHGRDAATPIRRVPVSRSASRYPVDWRARYRREHRVTTRLGRRVRTLRRRVYELEHARGLQVVGGGFWRDRQIAVALVIAREATRDPWPNCPDPVFDGAASWQTTVDCENSGDWYDSAGYYRCGLQFDPMWERRFGALCP